MGPVFPTNSKDDVDPALGFDQLKVLRQQSVHPIVAIGGITEQNIKSVLATGADGISSISMILGSNNIIRTVQAVRALY